MSYLDLWIGTKTQGFMERSILGRKTKVEDLTEKVARLKLSFAHHVVSHQDDICNNSIP